jgi:hypothetical protein
VRAGNGGLCLCVMLAGAALLRFWALGFGAGFDARPDEPSVITTLREMDTGRGIYPPLVAYGGGYFYPLYIATRFAATRAGFPTLAARIAGDEHGATVSARAWSASLSTLTVALVFVAARALAGPGWC